MTHVRSNFKCLLDWCVFWCGVLLCLRSLLIPQSLSIGPTAVAEASTSTEDGVEDGRRFGFCQSVGGRGERGNE